MGRNVVHPPPRIGIYDRTSFSVSFVPNHIEVFLCKKKVMSNTINGLEALRLAGEVSKIPDGTFTIAFYPYSRVKGRASDTLRTITGCKVRTQLPRDKFWIDSENYFLFIDADGNCKTCFRILIRFIGFPTDNFKLKKVIWL